MAASRVIFGRYQWADVTELGMFSGSRATGTMSLRVAGVNIYFPQLAEFAGSFASDAADEASVQDPSVQSTKMANVSKRPERPSYVSKNLLRRRNPLRRESVEFFV